MIDFDGCPHGVIEGACERCSPGSTEREREAWARFRESQRGEPELVETEIVTEAEIAVLEDDQTELHGASTHEELSRVVQEHIVNDFEAALNLIRDYQQLCKRALVPDLHWQRAHDLLAKYRMESVEPSVRIFDPEYGDITTHSTSIRGEATEEPETSRIEVVHEATDDDPFEYRVTITPDEETERATESEPKIWESLGTEIEEWEPPAPTPADQHPELRRSSEVSPVEPGELETMDLLAKQNAEQLIALGYEECPICEGTGVAKKGVLKGRECKRCSGLGVWRAPERAELIADEHGNVGLRPINGQPDE